MNDQQRIENAKMIHSQFQEQGYQAEKCTISILKANVVTLFTAFPIVLFCCLIFFAINGYGSINFSPLGFLLFYVLLVVSIVIHEFLHGITWALCSKEGWKNIHIGVIWKKLTPFCCCMEPLPFKSYLLGGLMPFLVLGLGLFAVSLLTNSIFWLTLSLFNIIAAGGDLMIAFMLLKHSHALILDHPTECGFWAFFK